MIDSHESTSSSLPSESTSEDTDITLPPGVSPEVLSSLRAAESSKESSEPETKLESTDVLNLTEQRTLNEQVSVEGRGLFLGEPVVCTIKPAPPDHGIVFERIDLDTPVRIPAVVTNVTERARRTTLRIGSVTIETVEHCLSAIAGLHIDNALIQLTGPELPSGDGSSQLFFEPMRAVGTQIQGAPRKFHKITEPITVEQGDSMLAALPSEAADLQLIYDLDYGDHGRLQRQVHAFRLSNGNYCDEIAPARTYSLVEEAKALWERGMCQHLTPKDVLVIGEDGPIDNAFRFDNEPVRHKVLDLLGDLSLLGRAIHGRVVAYRSGHQLNHRLVSKLLEQVWAKERHDTLTSKPAMDIRAIQKLLRHRYPMLMIDRVVLIEGNERAIGIKNVTINEPFFQGHYPGAPIMPGVLIVEGMAQLSGLLLSRVLEHTGRIPMLLSIDKVKLRRAVIPGDQLVMEAEAIRAQGRSARVKCKAYVGNELAAEAHVKFIMIDAEED